MNAKFSAFNPAPRLSKQSTWSSIEAWKIAGHSTVRMTEEYTKIQLTHQEELTQLIQERLACVGILSTTPSLGKTHDTK